MEKNEANTKRRHGFFTQAETGQLKYRPEDGAALEAVQPYPDRSPTSWVHAKSGSFIDLAQTTPQVTTYADESDVEPGAVGAPEPAPAPGAPKTKTPGAAT